MSLQKHKMPLLRQSLTYKNAVGNLEFYVTVGFYDDEPLVPGEIFVNVAKEGSTLGGLCSQIALALSMSLQYRVPWEDLAKHLRGARFEPSGLSADGEVQYPSITHAIADTVDRILKARRGEFYSGTLNEPPLTTQPQSLAERLGQRSNPSHAYDESRSPYPSSLEADGTSKMNLGSQTSGSDTPSQAGA